ncbi:putative acrAB operon repressor [Marinibacterium anthonyi]|nr:putative acrAB operon repressor [Marinibacterium anthonyi]
MKVSRARMAQNRETILAEAGRLFREKGFDAVSIAEVMKAAGLTHGAFYGHFGSKDDLIAETVAHATCTGDDCSRGFADYLADYLSPEHRDGADAGCATAALAAGLRHQCSPARAAMGEGVATQIDHVAAALARDSGRPVAEMRRAAIGCWSAMVGAMIMARSVDDPALSAEILAETRAWIEQSGIGSDAKP